MKYKRIDKYKYQLLETEHLLLPVHFDDHIETRFVILSYNTITIKPGYAWDGFSCSPDIRKALAASLVHDALYQLIKTDLLPIEDKGKCDKCLTDIMMQKGVSRFICRLYGYGVKIGGGKALKYGKEPKELEV